MSSSRRVNLILRAEAIKAEGRIYEKRGLNTTDAINKSLVLFDKILDYIDQDSEIRITSKDGKEIIFKII